MRRPERSIIGNWKMNAPEALEAYLEVLAARTDKLPAVAVCPPATLLAQVARTLEGTSIAVGAQDCHPAEQGAFTGDLSAPLVQRAGARLCLLGHSERRQGLGETSELVARKVQAVQRRTMTAVVCVGETLATREAGLAASFTVDQLLSSLPEGAALERLLIAYEPVWAIGTGRSANANEIEEMHGVIRGALVDRFGAPGQGLPILYGGSVTPANIHAIAPIAEVAGCLVGGASLDIAAFAALIEALG